MSLGTNGPLHTIKMDLLKIPAVAYAGSMNDRRAFLSAAVVGLVASKTVTGADESRSVKVIYKHELPAVTLDGRELTAVEVTFPPGVESPQHRHPGFVFGYVLEGEFRFQVRGQPEVVLRQGEMFYEPDEAVHAVAASASKTKPAKILALMFAEKGKPITMPAN